MELEFTSKFDTLDRKGSQALIIAELVQSELGRLI